MASNAAISVTVDDQAVLAMLAKAPTAVQAKLGELIEGAAIDVQREMRVEAPIAVTGQLRGSIRYTYTPSQLSAEITPTTPYAQDVESGTSAHSVSVAPGSSLRAWAMQKGINPYALRNSIAKKGTKAHPFVQPTYDKMKPLVEANVASGMTDLIAKLNQ